MLNDDIQTLIDPSVVQPLKAVAVSDSGVLIADRYRMLRPLGEGGMGNVYLAEDLVLARRVAIKTIRPELSGNEEIRSRIKRECRMHAAIGVHPHIITLYDSVEENGHIYLVMEYFAGETLAARLASQTGEQGLPLDQTLDIVRQVLRALACIHDQGIVHRDIKTANILLQQGTDGNLRVKLADFGIARAGMAAQTVTRLTALDVQGPGTPVYMAPERIDPQTFGGVCPASDLYAVGIILFELLTGHPPFTGSMTEIFSGHLVQPPCLDRLPATLPPTVLAVLRTALAKQPSERFQRAQSFLETLEGGHPSLDHAFIPPRAPSHPPVHAQTLLAVSAEPTAQSESVTLLNPSCGAGRGSDPSRRWRQGLMYAALACVLVLVSGWYLYDHFVTPSLTASAPVNSQEITTTGSEKDTVAVPANVPDDIEAAKTVTALQTLEKVRQQKTIESMAAAERPGGNPANEWQVIEDRSRRIR